ncbi:MAG: fatty acid desaturase family protein [Brevibacterium aurantiacum]|uniref:Acyl-CoA desaturase n=2 Tax=Brevibacterium aurantiacum TaxID=273384 RepID=A0A1D7W2H8_BREAU|nr:MULTISPECIES: acyl-CoA desaturase [Brevibacterium]AOP53162.1 Fatty acid desaturase [Brevibacterium aurantiacum]AZL12597.1 acyl-CoA desaturase [Brevibacterium aurantiacum]AZT96856.1 acyl-CoA desaturase [Brevibacterium aurantiacum]PCC19517.1 acyl-CoA desaturase [Brevibacterium aurantiacum]PCC44458.1 acyl-CoA desaturase [Brevibacterium aurantiacum]
MESVDVVNRTLSTPTLGKETRAEVLEKRRANRGTEKQEFTSDFSALMAQVKEAGLLARRPGWNTLRFVLLGISYVVAFAMLFLIGESWWQMATAVVFGILFTQTAYVAHDAAHRQIFTNGKVGEWVSTIIGNLFIGLSFGWWLKKHNALHHANPNKAGVDGDIAPGALIFDPADAQGLTGLRKWLAAHQGWFFFPLLTLAGVQLHVNSVKAILVGQSSIKRRWIEGIFIGIRIIGFPLIAIWAAGPLIGIVFTIVQVMVFGVHMGGSFAPNHKGQPIVPKDVKIDFLRRQTLMSRNISGGRPMGFLMGGLNYQIEHHLFPSMPSVNLHKVQPMVREYCAQKDIKYTETTLFESFGIIVRYLNRAGLGQADPFDCPVTAQFRSR